jgi:DNA repair protein SbcD/Mre11
MIVLHTSDWHLGQKLHENERYPEHGLFLDWLYDIILEQKVNVLLVSGDIFDTANPSHQSKTMYYDFLMRLKGTCCKDVVITGGNHDSPGELNAPKEILKSLNVHVIGCATEDIEDEIIPIKAAGEEVKVIICAVPFLRDRDIRKAVAGEDYDVIEQRVKDGIINHYEQLAKRCASYKTTGVPVIAMGHLYAAGVSASESEKEIHVGNLGQVAADKFPSVFDYVALGHIHRPQLVGKTHHIRYSGSPIPLSFSEYSDKKLVYILNIENGKIDTIKDLLIPETRKLIRIEGSYEEIANKIEALKISSSALIPWAEVKVKIDTPDPNILEDVKLLGKGKIEILLVRAENINSSKSLDQLITATESLEELSPFDVFTKKCETVGVSKEDQPEIFQAFNELVSIYHESEGK